MPRLLRRYLTCFYCGGKSPNNRVGKISSWQCPKCEAVNYLDEHGEITDPPAQSPSVPVPQAIQYAHTVPRATSPELSFSGDELFCRTCQKNQYLLTQALAEYLPSSNDPQYADYEASVEQYRKSLEERYPQVCEDCMPRVRNRIRAAGYAAKTDHMRRMLQKTKTGGGSVTREGWGWRNMVLFLGGQAYLVSIVLGLLWHVFGLLMRPEDGLRELDNPNFQTCLVQAYREKEVEPQCFHFMMPLARYALVCGVLSFWWNPKLQEKVRERGGRMSGLGSHLTLQGIVLGLRIASLWFVQDVRPIANALQVFKAAHLFMLVFMLISTIISLRLVKIDYTPNFSFNQTIEPLLPSPPGSSQNQGDVRRPIRSTFDTMGESFGSSFPISKLAEPTAHQNIQYPPSPTITASEYARSIVSDDGTETTIVSTVDPENKMDWTPTRPNTFQPNRPVQHFGMFAPQPQVPPPASGPVAPTPFFGTLPEAPKAPAHKILNPFPQPVFKRASLTSQKDFFSKMMISQGSPESKTALQEFGVKAEKPREEVRFQEGRFKFKEEQPSTGLEGMFDSVFSIRDESAQAIEQQQIQPGTKRKQSVAGQPVEASEESGLWAVGQMLLVGCLPIGIGAAIAFYQGWY